MLENTSLTTICHQVRCRLLASHSRQIPVVTKRLVDTGVDLLAADMRPTCRSLDPRSHRVRQHGLDFADDPSTVCCPGMVGGWYSRLGIVVLHGSGFTVCRLLEHVHDLGEDAFFSTLSSLRIVVTHVFR